MSALSKPSTGEYEIVPPNDGAVNSYLELHAIYDEADKHGFADRGNEPMLYAHINSERVVTAVDVMDDNTLLCTHFLPWNGRKSDTQEGRLYFALVGRRSGPSRQWALHPGQLMTLTDGDEHTMAPNGAESVLRQILSQR